MYPILFTVFGYNVYASPVFLALAIIIAIIVGKKEAERRGIEPRDFTMYWTTAIPAALLLAALNARMLNANLADLYNNPRGIFSNGLVSFGAVLGLLGWGYIMAKIRKQPAAPILDTVSLMLPLILGIYRIGCILNGCCYGVITNSPIGLDLPDTGGFWAERYPTQIMMMLFDFGLFAVFWKWRLKKPKYGAMTYAFLFSFSIFRLIIDGLRDLPPAFGPLNLHQFSSIAVLVVTLSFIYETSLERAPSNL
jgi:phosphatidylglycerol:prolipoprotein diacylglycerol transferase